MAEELSVSDLLDRIEQTVNAYVTRRGPPNAPSEYLGPRSMRESIDDWLESLAGRPAVHASEDARTTVAALREVTHLLFHKNAHTQYQGGIEAIYEERFLELCHDLREAVGAVPEDWAAWHETLDLWPPRGFVE